MITSLHSPHVEAVKALLGSRGNKERQETGTYVVESLQNIKAVISDSPNLLKKLFYTAEGIERLGSDLLQQYPLNKIESFEVSLEVMKAMTDTVTPQGLLAIAEIPRIELNSLGDSEKSALKIAYFWQIQDPGNAGTVIRAADAFDFDAAVFSDNSVDIYSPKVVRSTAGSFWRVPLITGITLEELAEFSAKKHLKIYVTQANGEIDLNSAAKDAKGESSIWIFGNEARGVPDEISSITEITRVSIPISERVESLNLATAASVVMYAVSAANK